MPDVHTIAYTKRLESRQPFQYGGQLSERVRERLMASTKATNLVWHAGVVTKGDREAISGHKACTIWMTGLPASGKSTLAVALEKRLWERGIHAYVLDGDNIRHGLNKDLGFSPEDRNENIRRIGEVAKLFT